LKGHADLTSAFQLREKTNMLIFHRRGRLTALATDPDIMQKRVISFLSAKNMPEERPEKISEFGRIYKHLLTSGERLQDLYGQINYTAQPKRKSPPGLN